jgi:opacity protein-like surface antigen
LIPKKLQICVVALCCAAFLLCCLSTEIAASGGKRTSKREGTTQTDTPADSLEPASDPEAEPPLVNGQSPYPSATRVRGGAQEFTDSDMKAAFDPVFVGSVEYLMVPKGFGVGFEIGWTSGEGTPQTTGSNWEVTASSVTMWALLLEVNVYYNLLDDKGRNPFMPYIGLGPGLWFGGERLSAEATRAPVGLVEGFNAEQLALGVSFGLSAIVGTTVRLWDDFKLLAEGRYVLSSSGSMVDLVSEEDEVIIDNTLYEAVERPGFNFTGWQVAVGVQW